MASFLRRKRARYAQSDAAAAQCDSQADICTEDWEDYVVVTVDARPEQPVNKHRVCSLESSLDSGYEEIHMPPPTPAATSTSATGTEEDTAAGAGSISASRNGEARQQETDEERPVCRTDRDLGRHHGFFGQRYYKYDDTECEGNRYITDEEL